MSDWLLHQLERGFNTLRPRQDGRHFADDDFKRIFLKENVWISIDISLKFIPKGPIDNIPALVQIMAWRRSGDKPLSEPMVVRLPTHICVTRPLWVKPMISEYQRYPSLTVSVLTIQPLHIPLKWVGTGWTVSHTGHSWKPTSKVGNWQQSNI